jgi:hypothetical protein
LHLAKTSAIPVSEYNFTGLIPAGSAEGNQIFKNKPRTAVKLKKNTEPNYYNSPAV